MKKKILIGIGLVALVALLSILAVSYSAKKETEITNESTSAASVETSENIDTTQNALNLDDTQVKTEEELEDSAIAENSIANKFKAPYMQKGVYEAQTATGIVYYVFSDTTYGYIKSLTDKTGIPFDCLQENGEIVFSFGGENPSEKTFKIKGITDENITGSFVNEAEMTFTFLKDAIPEDFDVYNYLNAENNAEGTVYEDANGWNVKYNPTKFDIMTQNAITVFTYVGEGGGANMVTASYNANMTVQEKIEELKEVYGEGNTYSEGIFPGTEDVTGYWISSPVYADNPGLHRTAILREYMDGYLMFEVIGQLSGDEKIDTEISDYLAEIIDSVTFTANDK